MALCIGLTGGIGSGKTAVSDRFANLGITIADADVSARRVVEPGTTALAEIASYFGQDILDPDGKLNRAALRHIVFDDPAKRKWLESVTVPAILKDLRDILDRSTSAYSILMLSSGSGQSPWINRHLVVDVPEDVQIQRVMARDGNTRDQVLAIMATQPDRQARLAYADDVIVNDGDLQTLDSEIATLHQKYLKLAEA